MHSRSIRSATDQGGANHQFISLEFLSLQSFASAQVLSPFIIPKTKPQQGQAKPKNKGLWLRNSKRRRVLEPVHRSKSSTNNKQSARKGRQADRAAKQQPTNDHEQEILERALSTAEFEEMVRGDGPGDHAGSQVFEQSAVHGISRSKRSGRRGRASISAERHFAGGAELWPLGRGRSPMESRSSQARLIGNRACDARTPLRRPDPDQVDPSPAGSAQVSLTICSIPSGVYAGRFAEQVDKLVDRPVKRMDAGIEDHISDDAARAAPSSPPRREEARTSRAPHFSMSRTPRILGETVSRVSGGVGK